MKKILLLATTAFVAASIMTPTAKAEASVTVGGYMNQYFGWAGNDDPTPSFTDPQDFQQFSSVEVHVDAEYATENGITVGAHIQLMGDNDETSTRAVDEHFASIEGGFGRVEIGATSSAPYKMHVIAPAVGMPINNGDVDQLMADYSGTGIFLPPVNDRNVLGGTFLEVANSDAGQKISYFTPSYNGFMAGISYQPDVTTDNVIADTSGFAPAVYHDGVSAGLGYYGSFNDVMIETSLGFFYASSPRSVIDDYEALNLGLNLGMPVGDGDVVVGGSYAQVFSDDSVHGEGYSFDIGASYDAGPWAASLTYMRSDTKVTSFITPAADMDTVAAGMRYRLTEGADITTTLGWTDFEVGGTDVNDGIFATAGILLDF